MGQMVSDLARRSRKPLATTARPEYHDPNSMGGQMTVAGRSTRQ